MFNSNLNSFINNNNNNNNPSNSTNSASSAPNNNSSSTTTNPTRLNSPPIPQPPPYFGDQTFELMNRQLSPWLQSMTLPTPPTATASTTAAAAAAPPPPSGGQQILSPNTIQMLLASNFMPQNPPSSNLPAHASATNRQVSLNLLNMAGNNTGSGGGGVNNKLSSSRDQAAAARLFAPLHYPPTAAAAANNNNTNNVSAPSATNAMDQLPLQLPSSVNWFSRPLPPPPAFGMDLQHLSQPQPPLEKKKRGPNSGTKQKKAASASSSDDTGATTPKITSKHRGVCWYKRTKKWVVQTKVNGKRVHVGYFDDEEKAAEAYRNTVAGIHDVHGNKKMAIAATGTTTATAGAEQVPLTVGEALPSSFLLPPPPPSMMDQSTPAASTMPSMSNNEEIMM